jgi:Holliday junction DNA helicase RuvB
VKEQIINASQDDKEEDVVFDRALRPKQLHDYIGQEKIKNSLRVCIKAAKIRKEPLEHILIYGPPGLGKTTLAYVLANEVGANIKITSGPAIERPGDLVSILTNLEDSDVIFIDEIHRLNKIVEEVLYPAMEDFAVDLVIGKGPSAKTLRVDLPRFTLIGATTRASLISAPMRDRFGIVHPLDFYENDEIGEIIKRSADILKIETEEEGLREIAARARKTPRIANRLLRRVRDFATVYNKGVLDLELAKNSLEQIGIDEKGLDDTDRKFLSVLVDKFNGGPVGIETLAAASSIDKKTIEDIVEPYLMQLGFIRRTPKGRVASDSAWEYLGKTQRIKTKG